MDNTRKSFSILYCNVMLFIICLHCLLHIRYVYINVSKCLQMIKVHKNNSSYYKVNQKWLFLKQYLLLKSIGSFYTLKILSFTQKQRFFFGCCSSPTILFQSKIWPIVIISIECVNQIHTKHPSIACKRIRSTGLNIFILISDLSDPYFFYFSLTVWFFLFFFSLVWFA